ncbi:MAG: cytochrome b/b6 domain-containing protein [Hyphomicrobiales bacterium]
MLTNTKLRYGFVAQILHWVTAALILFLLPLGVYMHELPQSSDAEISQKVFLYSLHKSVGIALLTVAVLRVVWAVFNKKPAPLHAERKLETFVAESIHWLLYISILAVPVSGWLHHAATDGFAPIWWFENQDLSFVKKDPKLAEIFGAMHFFFAATMMISLALHIAGALKHAFIDKDSTLARMVPGKPVEFGELDHASTHSFAPIALAGLVFLSVVGLSYASVQLFSAETPPGTALQASSGEWQVRADESSLGIKIIQSGAPVSGAFAAWTADIRFDPEDLANAQVRVEIDVASLSLGSVTSQALSGDFLKANEHPKAVFTSRSFTKVDGKQFSMLGDLELSGVVAPATVDFTLSIEADVAKMTGAAMLNRMEFEVGSQGFGNESSVAFPVEVQITIVADRVK